LATVWPVQLISQLPAVVSSIWFPNQQ